MHCSSSYGSGCESSSARTTPADVSTTAAATVVRLLLSCTIPCRRIILGASRLRPPLRGCQEGKAPSQSRCAAAFADISTYERQQAGARRRPGYGLSACLGQYVPAAPAKVSCAQRGRSVPGRPYSLRPPRDAIADSSGAAVARRQPCSQRRRACSHRAGAECNFYVPISQHDPSKIVQFHNHPRLCAPPPHRQHATSSGHGTTHFSGRPASPNRAKRH